MLYAGALEFLPVAKYISTQHYGFPAQNWSVAQDREGRIYFANNTGLLQYDGTSWEMFSLPAASIIRSVYVDDNRGRVYIGSFEEFGYLTRDKRGEFIYTSLRDRVESFEFLNDEIWNIKEMDGNIYFQSFRSSFIYDGTEVRSYSDTSMLNLLPVEGKLYTQCIGGEFAEVRKDGLRSIVTTEELGGASIVGAVSSNGRMVLFSENDGVFTCKEGEITPWEVEYHNELKTARINRVTMTRDSIIVVGTLSGGVYGYNSEGQLLWRIGAENQIENNTVLGLLCDNDNNIWVALDNGAAFIHHNSPFKIYRSSDRSIGMIYDVTIEDDYSYIASNQGLYAINNATHSAKILLKEQSWIASRYGDELLCGHNRGLWTLDGFNKTLISSEQGVSCIEEFESDGEKLLLVGGYLYLDVYRKDSRGKWAYSHHLDDFQNLLSKIKVDHRGNIWVEHMRRGIYKLRIDTECTKVLDSKRYTTVNLIEGHSGELSKVFKVEGRVIFTDNKYFYTYDDMTDELIPYSTMNEKLKGLEPIHQISKMRGTLYWFLGLKSAYLVECGGDCFEIVKQFSYGSVSILPVDDKAVVVTSREDSCWYFCLNNSILKVSEDYLTQSTSTHNVSLRVSRLSVSDENGDVDLLDLGSKNTISHHYKNITIQLSYPFYDGESYTVRYRLEGLQEEWIEGLPTLIKHYDNLPSGSYCFEAEIISHGVVKSSVRVPFIIGRVWYYSYVAIGVYMCLVIFGFVWSLRYVKRRAESKKDAVIAKQKLRHASELERKELELVRLRNQELEQGIKVKSKELSEISIQSIAHQEFLLSLREEIVKQKLASEFTRTGHNKLLKLIDQSIVSREESWQIFQSNFDHIHEKFFIRLKEEYPQLTTGDLRMCALFRLNLSTKDICTFLNISPRGVDAARYRIRKKLDLPSKFSLTEFIINFK